jgi:hypothetical protein
VAVRPPGVELCLEGVDASELLVRVAMDGQTFLFLPAMDGANGAVKISGDVLPGVHHVAVRLGDGLP